VGELCDRDRFGDRNLTWSGRRWRLLLAGAVQPLNMAAERSDGAHTLIVGLQRSGHGKFSTTTRVRAFSRGRRFGRGLANFLRALLLVFIADHTATPRRHGTSGGLRFRFFLLFKAPLRFFFGVPTQGILGC